jgi:hypothetical protein
MRALSPISSSIADSTIFKEQSQMNYGTFCFLSQIERRTSEIGIIGKLELEVLKPPQKQLTSFAARGYG